MPHRTRLNRRLRAQQRWAGYFLADATVLGVADSYGIELRHPVRAGRRTGPIGRKGKSNQRWIVGGKLCVVLNKLGLVADWDCATANVPDGTFQPLLAYYDGQMIILTDTGFHRASGDPANVKIRRRGHWNVRMIVETVFSMMSVVWGTKTMRDRAWDGFEARLACTIAAFNIRTQWHGLQPDDQGRPHLSIAQFTL